MALFLLHPTQISAISDLPLCVLQELVNSLNLELKVPISAIGTRGTAGSRILLNSGPVKAIIG